MKKHRNIVLIILTIFILVPLVVYSAAFSTSSNLTKRPLGGRIIKSGQSAEIACATISGPIFVRPYNLSISGPFFVRNSSYDSLGKSLKDTQIELSKIRSSQAYTSGNPTQEMINKERELVQKMKSIREKISLQQSFPGPGKHILGTYSSFPDMETCYNPETGAPIPAFEIKPYGTSR